MKKQLPIKEIIKKKSAQNNSLDHNESDRLSDFGEGLMCMSIMIVLNLHLT